MREPAFEPPASFLGVVAALLWTSDGSGRRTWFSDEWLRVRGRPLANEWGDGWLAGVHPDDRGELAETYFRAVDRAEPYAFEYRLLTNDGSYWRIRERARPLPGGGLAGVCDMAAAVDAIAELDARRQFFEAVFLAAPAGIQVFTPDGTSVRMNPQQRELLGYRPGFEPTNLYNDPVRAGTGIIEHFERARRGEAVEATMEIEVEEDGSTRRRWVESTLFPVANEQGDVLVVVEYLRDVTERVLTEKALRESEEQYRVTVESLNDMVFRTDREGTITFLSPAANRQGGWAEGALQGRPAAEVWHDPADYRRFLDHILSRGRVNDFETRMLNSEGRPAWVSLNATVMRDADGHVVGITGSIRDITERKRMEAALAEAEERFRRIVETGAEGIYLIDLDGRIEFANEAMAQMLGYSVGELTGKMHRDLVVSGRWRPRETQLWRKGEIERFETEYRHRTGRRIQAVISIAPMYDSTGTLTGGLAMVMDMTERYRAEAERDRIFKLSLDMLAVLDPRGRLARCNPAWERTTGYTIVEIEGKEVFTFIHPEDLANAREAREQLMRGEAVLDLRLRFRCATGYRWFSWNISAPMAGAYNTYCVVRDVTEQVEAQQAQAEMLEALRQNAAALEEQAKVLDQLRIRAEFLADHDTLTSALNRRAWFEAGAKGGDWCVAVIDVDHFKRINDTFGHPAGDAVLIEVTRRLMETFGPVGGVVGRLGGEEFGVLLPCSLDDAYRACEEARVAVNAELVRLDDGRGIPVSVSVGLAPWCETGQSRERSLARTYEEADRALYEAKNSGRARLVVWSRAA